jgi:hypothetical protein
VVAAVSDFVNVGENAIYAPVPLTADEAYWHACTGTPYEPRMLPLRYDSAALACRFAWLATVVDPRKRKT